MTWASYRLQFRPNGGLCPGHEVIVVATGIDAAIAKAVEVMDDSGTCNAKTEHDRNDVTRIDEVARPVHVAEEK